MALRSTFRRLYAVSAHSPTTSLPSSPLGLTPIGRTKTSTGLVGLPVHPSPFLALVKTYDLILSTLAKIPPGAVYRRSVEAVVRNRREVVAPYAEMKEHAQGVEEAVRTVEERLGAGLIEEVVVQAEDEHALAEKMVEWKA